MKKLGKMKQKPTDIVICNALYLLFGDFYEDVKQSKVEKADENNDINYGYGLCYLYKAYKKEDTIRKLWGSRCQHLLSGIIIYLYKLDPYFSPKLNTIDQFYIKIYRNCKILTEIGLGKRKAVFPFKKLFNNKKKIY